jgi:transcriptional regulator with XRE-family HTH domain
MAQRKNPEFSKEFSRRVRDRMEYLGITTAELVRLTDLPTSTVYHIVKNTVRKVPQADTVAKLARGLGVSTDSLINF